MHNVKFVPSSGDKNALIMLIGEAPGAEEEEQGLPFVGPSGKLLDEAFDILSWERKRLYITNAVKVRPPDNRTPNMDEVESWKPLLVKEIEEVAPILIITLGSTAVRSLREEMRVVRDQGKMVDLSIGNHKCSLAPIFHPSYVLRGYIKKDEWFNTWRRVQYESGL